MITSERMNKVRYIYNDVYRTLEDALVGQDAVKKVVASSLLCDKSSKLLLTGNTGTGKTTLSNFLGSSFKKERISVTSDLLPSEVQEQLIARPDFTFLQIDEFNRASGKLQSAFLELFAEGQITYSGAIHDEFQAFYVFATQNSADISGVFNVPQAVYDRFDVNVYFGDLKPEEKKTLFFSGFEPKRKSSIDLNAIDYTTGAVADFELDEGEQNLLLRVFDYMDSLIFNGERLFAGSNVRAHKYAIKLAKINAMVHGRNHILPSDLADYIIYLYLHRIDQNVASLTNQNVHDLLENASKEVLKMRKR